MIADGMPICKMTLTDMLTLLCVWGDAVIL